MELLAVVDHQGGGVDHPVVALGQGLLVWYAAQKKAEGMTLEELTAWVEENRSNLCHWFTVDDLMFLNAAGVPEISGMDDDADQ